MQGSEAFQDGVHRYLSVEAEGVVTNSLAERVELVPVAYNVREITTVFAVTVAREFIVA